MNQLITLSGIDHTALSATDAARVQRDSLLTLATGVGTVSSADQAARAAFVLKELKGFTREIESSRADVKAPVLEIGKKIDALAKDLTTKVDAEATRVSRVLGAWQAEQNRLAEEARRKAWEEEQRIREEAARKEREAAEREQARQAELERKAAAARTEETAAKYRQQAEAAALRAHQEQERRDFVAEQAIVSTRVSAAALVPPKPAGVATREEIKFEVTDIIALYEAAAYLVSLEPNTAAIKAALKALTNGQHLPGVRHWKEALTVVR
jgi:dTMP kinase